VIGLDPLHFLRRSEDEADPLMQGLGLHVGDAIFAMTPLPRSRSKCSRLLDMLFVSTIIEVSNAL
jgi:hypothetical protein